jgi:uncharacterized protein
MRRSWPFLLVLLSALGCQASPPAPSVVAAGIPPAPRQVSVTGNAEMKVAPDEFVISAGVDSYATEAQAAKRANDQAMSALIAVTQANKVDPKDVRTEGFTLQPHHEGPYDSRRVVGYEARKTLVLILHDADKVETLLAELFKSGANRLDSVTTSSTKIIAQRKEARVTAVAAAREKAEAMAAALGQKLGRPLKIEEDAGLGGYSYRTGNAFLNDSSDNNAVRPVVGDTMATGKLRIQANVSVTFELVD